MSETPVVLVTGAAGLIGHKVRTLLEGEGVRVLATDRLRQDPDGRPLLRADLTDIHRLHAITAAHALDGIIHCGAFSGPMVSVDNPYDLVCVNVMGTVNLLELARIRNCRRVVCCSSTSAYGALPAQAEGASVGEDVVLRPASVYGATKAAIEPLVDGYARQHGVDGVCLRLSWVYGPGRTTDCIIRTMLDDALHGRPTRIAWGAEFPRQYLHVEDAARALLLAWRHPAPARRTYTITGDRYVTLGALAGIVRSILPAADIDLGTGPDPLDEVQPRFDIAAARRDLGYAPLVGLEDGIAAYADWLKARAG